MIKISCLILSAFLMWAGSALAQWTPVNGPATGEDIRSIAFDPANADVLYAGGAGTLYRSKDGGKTWKTVLRLSSSSSGVNAIRVNANRPETVLAGTDEGVYRSDDA